MIQELNTAIEKWQQQLKADEAENAGMVSTMQYTPSDQLRDTLNPSILPLAEPFTPQVHKAFGEWLAEPVIDGWKDIDTREPTYNLYRLAITFFAADMAKVIAAENQLTRFRFAE